MTLASGSALGPYEVTARLGAGGMGEVWRATDTKLGRDVALKVLPSDLAGDPERHARFEREARVLASLNHPNVATLYGLEHLEGQHVLVMELVEGEGLGERIARGPVPVDEAVPMALQIAEGLEAAHEAGIVHRDLKPANIRIRPDGTVKVLDFGLAKAWESESSDSGLSLSPTITQHHTRAGVLLGTAAYMAPEQARGQPVDRRADIWAFGAVLWEMLTGNALFSAETVSDTLAGVLRQEVDLDELPSSTPPAIRRLLRRCLEREPKSRLHDIADARLELEAARDEAEDVPAAAAATTARRGLWVAGIAGLALAGALGAVTAWHAKPIPSRPSWKLSLAPPPELSGFRVSPRISPTGRSMAYIADGRLWVQDLDGLTPRAVPESEGASALTWSPDGRFIAFAARSELWRTLPNGDAAMVTALTEAVGNDAGGIGWTEDDELVFSTGNSGLLTVPVTGGTPRPLLEPDRPRESDFHEPLALPGGRGIVFIVHRTPGGIDTLALFARGRRRTLFQKEKMWLHSPAWSESGHLLVGSAGSNPGVWAIPVRTDDLTTTGEPFLVAADLGTPSISRDGTLLLSNTSSTGRHQLSLVDRHGERHADVGEQASHADHATFSPDGTRVAVCVSETRGQSVWVHDLERSSRSRLWSNVECGSMAGGISWSPDGQRLMISELATGTIRSRRADGSDQEATVGEGSQPDFSPDGRLVAFTRTSEEGGKDLWVLDVGDEASARPFLATPANEEQPQVSPDGRYLAYVSDDAGRREVHLRPFPAGAGQWQVSEAGGELPRWSADGRHLYFLQDDSIMMEVEVGLLGTPVLSDPHPLFTAAAHRLGPDHGYDVSPDGESFVMTAFGSGSRDLGDLTLISPWPDGSVVR